MLFDNSPKQSTVILRPYQEEMGHRTVENLLTKKHRGTLNVAPMGCGKSLTMAHTAISLSNATGRGVLILAHYRGLVLANQKAVQRLGRQCYIYRGEEKNVIWSDVINHGAIVSGSVQAIAHALKRVDPKAFPFILLDEGHHAILDSLYHKIVEHFGAQVALYTATPRRADGAWLVGDKSLCQSVAYNGQIRDFVRDGWILMPRIHHETAVKMDWTLIGDDSSAITEKEAEKLWESNKANYAVIEPLLKSAGDMPVVGFAPSVRLAKLWAALINDRRPGLAEYVASYRPGDYTDAKMEFGSSDRRLIEAQFEGGEIQYLLNQGVYLEGADLVRARCCMMGIITDSWGKYVQAVGRVLRPANDPDGNSILVGYERATVGQRLDRIAQSTKPWSLVLDYAGSSGPNKLVHAIDIFADNEKGMHPKVRQRVIEVAEERSERGDDVNLEEILQEQEEAYKQFMVRDAAVRKKIAVDVETVTQEIDPWGAPEVTAGARYVQRKINPAAPKVIEQIQKYSAELGKQYSEDFYRSLTNAKAFGVLNGLRKKINEKRKTEPCPSWIQRELSAMGIYDVPANKLDGLNLLQKRQREKRREQ